jgi:hypothetical protein
MANDVVKESEHELCNVDGFQGFSDEVEGGDEQGANSRRIQGQQMKFSLDYRWINKDGDELPKRDLVTFNILRVAQHWSKDKTQGPIEDRVLEPHQPFPDFDKLNDAIPRSEWLEGLNGQPRGPWHLYLLDMTSMDKYTYIANLTTIGAWIAVRELADKVKWKRKFRGDNVYAVVKLSDTYMHTRFGGRQRPHFDVVDWVTFGPDGEVKQLEAPTQQKLEQLRSGDSEQRGVKSIAPITAKEAVNDEIQF